MMNFEWSDLRYFLAVARSGSTAAGARLLDVDQSTCARRITALERALKASLFDRTPAGFKLTAVGDALVDAAEKAEVAVMAFGRKALEVTLAEHKLINFTTSDWMAEHICQAAISQFTLLHPNIRITLDVSARRADLSAGEADVALRGGFSLDEPTLIARKVAETPWSFYCGTGFAQGRAIPRSTAEALSHRLALPAGQQAEKFIRQLRPDVDIGYTSNSTASLVDAIAGGNLVGPLPEAVGDSHNELHFCYRVEYATPSLWIVYPKRLRGAAHIRIFVDHLARHIAHWCQKQRESVKARS